MNEIVGEGFLEELRDKIAADSGLGYVVGENLTCGDSPDPIQDFPHQLAASRNRLTIYDNGGNLIRSGSRTHSERTVRFVVRGDHPQDAVNRAWRVLQWIENDLRQFSTTSFSARHTDTPILPSVIVKGEDGSALANFAATFYVLNLPT